MGVADLGGATSLYDMEVKESKGNLLVGFPATNEGLLKRKELVPVLKRACSSSIMANKPTSLQNYDHSGKSDTTGTVASTTVNNNESGNHSATPSQYEGIMKQQVLVSLDNNSTATECSRQDHELMDDSTSHDTNIVSNQLRGTSSTCATFTTDSSCISETMVTCRTNQFPPVYMSLPKWAESVNEQGYVLSSDLFQPCDDNPPVPSTKIEKEARRTARLKKIGEVKKLEQSQQRKARFLKRQKRFDEDDGVDPTPTNTSMDKNHSSPAILPPLKSKKKVMWQEEGNLLEFHVYSPVRVEVDREETPVVNS